MVYKTAIGCFIGSLGLLFTTLRDDFTLTMISYVELFVAVFIINLIVFILLRLLVLSLFKAIAARGIVKLSGALASDGTTSSGVAHGLLHDIQVTSLDDLTFSNDADVLLIDVVDKEVLTIKMPEIVGLAARRHLIITPTTFNQLPTGYTGMPAISNDLITLKTSPLHPWQENVKRIIDIIGAILIFLIASPIMLLIMICVKRSSPGPIFYKQERVGRFGKKFQILKFRSMVSGAESSGPQLAVTGDPRTTPFGRWMRRWRLDELPQCINVLKGEMSLVGPRPERSYYANQLIASEPKYALIYQVRPGITSWGQIKYGYASTIEEMLLRFRYDLLYMEQMSLVLDLKILVYTIAVLFKGQGR